MDEANLSVRTGMYEALRVDLTSQRSTLNRVHLNQMLSLSLWNSLPTSGDSLQYCRSMRKRRRDRVRLPLPNIKQLESWASQSQIDFLILDTDTSTAGKSFMVDLIDLVRESDMPIIWALRYANYWNRPVTMREIMQTLVLQAMEVASNHLLNDDFPVTVEQLREAAYLSDWITILHRLLSRLHHIFIVLDCDILAHATERVRSLAIDLLDMLRWKLSGNVKIVVAMSSVTVHYAKALECAGACIRIRVGDFNYMSSRRLKPLGFQHRRAYAR